jgi:hypothetical protein
MMSLKLYVMTAAVISVASTAALAAPPEPRTSTKIAPKTTPVRASTGLVGVNKQTIYSNSSSFAQTKRVMRTESSHYLRGGTTSLWERDRSEEATRQQRRNKMRSSALQQRLRLQKESREQSLKKTKQGQGLSLTDSK